MGRKYTDHTPEQIQFVRDHMHTMTHREMGYLLDKEIWEIATIKENIREGVYDSPAKAVKQSRPPAVYLNRSHEQLIDYWLSVEV